jgi:hypothetical protein
MTANKPKIPVIKCLPRPDFPEGMMFWCPFCNRWHMHGIGNGPRVSHCFNPDSPHYHSEYKIQMIPKPNYAKSKKQSKNT